jgi:hypothetical protein
MPPERLPWQTYSYHPIGRRDIGRPRRRWRQFLYPRNGSTDSTLEWEEEEEKEEVVMALGYHVWTRKVRRGETRKPEAEQIVS